MNWQRRLFKTLIFLIFFQGLSHIALSQGIYLEHLYSKIRRPVALDGNVFRIMDQSGTPDPGDMSVTVSGQLALCSHADRGHILLDVSGGVPPYTFVWNNLQTVQNRYSLLSGTYTVWIKDSAGHEIKEKIVVQPPFPLIIEMAETIDVTCNNSDGEAKINIKMGRGEPYKIEWSHGLTNTLHAEDLPSGTYFVKVSDQFNCHQTIYFEIKSIMEAIQLEEEIENISCSNQPKGAIKVTASGGKAPFQYLWSNGNTSDKITDLEAGEYALTVTDANGCTISRTYTLKASEPMTVTAEISEVLFCADAETGKISLDIQGGIAPYTFLWNNGSKEKDLENLTSGEYSVKVTDSLGCEITKIFTVSGPEKLTAKIETTVDVNCETNATKGVAWVSIKGGKAPYQIKWLNLDKNTQEIEFLTERELSVEVTDANGCKIIERIFVDYSNIAAKDRLGFDVKKLQLNTEDEILVDDQLKFESKISEEFIAWEWSFGDGTVSLEKDPIHVFKMPGEFEVVLKAYDIFGCSSVQKEEVKVNEVSEYLMMPNAFTPNSDGLNDVFKPETKGISGYRMYIFNKWGEMIFSNGSKSNEGWNGTLNGQLLPSGNYVYKVSFQTPNGEMIEKAGTVSLIRENKMVANGVW
ncbi:gliding motility-associated C-terminal domain-containing protein [Aquiflexum gelatinilyticum]|uniref:T9SS type B sorting domain-containing protein n=1 Tax=Aquiflexum gelatinilyticum TaxID=2961943 RepID=UPI00216908E4|nr:gliding motility-associated C-terminal domain-containing protein [Aquiflexum gelatinilyticum]MCS4435623.1 gliding motility-associated C-terminal domain-containing protein [Aquiflexum gelatinilyticum]